MRTCLNHFRAWDRVWARGCLPHLVITVTASTSQKKHKTTLALRQQPSEVIRNPGRTGVGNVRSSSERHSWNGLPGRSTHHTGPDFITRASEKKGKSHQSAIRALTFKWIRIIYRCWKIKIRYDEAKYLLALEARKSPLLKP